MSRSQNTSPPHDARTVHIWLLLVPGLLTLGATFLLPLLWLLRISFDGAASGAWTFANYASVLSDTFYAKVFLNTLRLGAVVTVFTVLAAYPLALFLARTRSAWRSTLAVLAISPLLTSTVVRTYGWMVILGNQGLVNSTLSWLGWIDQPLRISNNFFAVSIALVEILMPYAVLTIMSGLGRLSADLEDAAASLGASPLRVFQRVILPLSLPSIATASLLIFVLTISAFVTPRLAGGGRVFVLGTEVFGEATVTLNWPLAATLSILLFVLFALVISLYTRAMLAWRHA